MSTQEDVLRENVLAQIEDSIKRELEAKKQPLPSKAALRRMAKMRYAEHSPHLD